jgi:hypothetical protein
MAFGVVFPKSDHLDSGERQPACRHTHSDHVYWLALTMVNGGDL